MMTFMQNALIGISLVSVVSALIGTYIMTRRMVFISGGITHACFGGLGLGYFLGISPTFMATIFAIAGSLGVDRLSRHGSRSDSAIAVIWALGMALGILFIFLTKGFVPELNTFLFGNVLTITRSDIICFAIFTLLLIAFYTGFHRLIVAVSFDPDFARTRNIPVTFLNTAMTVLVAIAIVLTIRMTGIMLLMSMISLPQMTAEKFTRSYSRLLFLSLAISATGCLGGLAMAYIISVPASATIVLLQATIYLIASAIASLRK